jgi:hypothetical protein
MTSLLSSHAVAAARGYGLRSEMQTPHLRSTVMIVRPDSILQSGPDPEYAQSVKSVRGSRQRSASRGGGESISVTQFDRKQAP